MRQGRRRKHAYFTYGYSPLVMSDLYLPGSYIRLVLDIIEKHMKWNNIRSHVVGRCIKSYQGKNGMASLARAIICIRFKCVFGFQTELWISCCIGQLWMC